MKKEKYYLALDDFEKRLIINCLNEKRNNLISKGKYTDAVDELLLKFANAKQKKFKVIYREAYDIKKEEITRKLSEGQKLFIISVYQTIGAGQNLQYKIPRGLEKELIKINDRPSRGKKDFDAIYLEKPTNLLVNLGNNLSEEEFVKYLYHTEFFQETSELSTYGAFQHIKRAFCYYITGNASQLPCAPNVYNSKSVVLLSTRTIIQAIGRICRTNQKRKNIYP